jgi:NO-binding membrane sensor protein with MHYT domain
MSATQHLQALVWLTSRHQHFIGNRAIQMGEGEDGLQIAFSGGITALSFFVPIVVLALAFVAIGSSSIVSWWRVCVGGLLCGTGVCGMHYLGNLSIRNYTCEYEPANVVGSAIIAVTASTVALSMFFVFRAMWANVWWKRGLSALMLAGAVSGMHWCAAVGTRYRLVRVIPLEESEQNTTLIVVICLVSSRPHQPLCNRRHGVANRVQSVIACMTIAGLAILRARNMSRSAERAQKITLAAAVFDLDGRILVDPDGLVPSTIITNSFPETVSTTLTRPDALHPGYS